MIGLPLPKCPVTLADAIRQNFTNKALKIGEVLGRFLSDSVKGAFDNGMKVMALDLTGYVINAYHHTSLRTSNINLEAVSLVMVPLSLTSMCLGSSLSVSVILTATSSPALIIVNSFWASSMIDMSGPIMRSRVCVKVAGW
jgi:hypothetical protein